MSLETRIKEGFERAAQVIKARLPATRDLSATLNGLANNQAGSFQLANSHAPAEVLKVTASHAVDVCLYLTDADRTADLSRLQGAPDTAPNVPVIGQWRTSAVVLSVAGVARAVNVTTVYGTVVNRSGSTQDVTMTIKVEDR
ncbi:hypothetical protein D3875_02580 [Deinococcus cavernae]|uniref:Uncharacterized protein n=1 Tax=Deinococcus cavernae TaxID=2320857 RepID=A0A418VFL3_9DEIO|nr:hypothetical protein [Deinococcus cavernae]RJF74899.1 hypothetical protein D3875_02580 [Deinococcus cavernae]